MHFPLNEQEFLFLFQISGLDRRNLGIMQCVSNLYLTQVCLFSPFLQEREGTISGSPPIQSPQNIFHEGRVKR